MKPAEPTAEAVPRDTEWKMSDPADRLHPAEHRGYRELYAASRQVARRWSRLSAALGDLPVAMTLDEARGRVLDLIEALEEKTAEYDLHGRPAAQGAGVSFAYLRGALVDRAADTGAVLRLAVLDVEHVATLLAHLAQLARARGDDGLERFCRKWEKVIRPDVDAVREAAIALGASPDRAGAAIDSSPLTRAAHGAGWVAGSVGEAVDRVAGGLRRGRGTG
jgi:hypothetical protein